ncbi:MAG: glycosyltransferase family 2 protein [Methylacidiphilales bacterium]|nr:glycosyltransferase family 2 protein [Candidatus Methylacidiphilales bacterium]
MNSDPVFSVVVPFYNEAENLPQLIREIDAMLRAMEEPAEIILVNDGSTDTFSQPPGSPAFLIRWLQISQNSGQSAAMYYGMQEARGRFIILMDADLQNDPMDAPRMLRKLEDEQLDLVTGVRVHRHDNFFRRLSSTIANKVRGALLQDHTSDTGCTLKVIRREAARRLPGWNGMHRFIPALVLSAGYRIGETPVEHRPRHAGVSKVAGTKRALRATIDLIGMLWYSRRQFKGRLLGDKP